MSIRRSLTAITASLPALGLRESPGPLQKIQEQPANLVFRCLIREVPRRIKTLGGVITITIASALRTCCFASSLSLYLSLQL